MTEKQKATQKILGRNNEIDRHVRTLERLYETNVRRAEKAVDDKTKTFYLEILQNLREAQNEQCRMMAISEKLINLIPDKTQKDILMLYHVACIPMDEVAVIIHYDRSTTWVKYKKALDNLATALDNGGRI